MSNLLKWDDIPVARIVGYLATGVDRQEKRFKIQSSSLDHICMVNM